jgi:hypothetical protein
MSSCAGGAARGGDPTASDRAAYPGRARAAEDRGGRGGPPSLADRVLHPARWDDLRRTAVEDDARRRLSAGARPPEDDPLASTAAATAGRLDPGPDRVATWLPPGSPPVDWSVPSPARHSVPSTHGRMETPGAAAGGTRRSSTRSRATASAMPRAAEVCPELRAWRCAPSWKSRQPWEVDVTADRGRRGRPAAPHPRLARRRSVQRLGVGGVGGGEGEPVLPGAAAGGDRARRLILPVDDGGPLEKHHGD